MYNLIQILFIAGLAAVLVAYIRWLLKKEKQSPLRPQAIPSSSKSGPRCPTCGHINPVGCDFCRICGTLLGEEETRIY